MNVSELILKLEGVFYLKSQDEYPSGMECWSKLSRLAMELALNKQISSESKTFSGSSLPFFSE
jgi:hypothetical protein